MAVTRREPFKHKGCIAPSGCTIYYYPSYPVLSWITKMEIHSIIENLIFAMSLLNKTATILVHPVLGIKHPNLRGFPGTGLLTKNLGKPISSITGGVL